MLRNKKEKDPIHPTLKQLENRETNLHASFLQQRILKKTHKLPSLSTRTQQQTKLKRTIAPFSLSQDPNSKVKYSTPKNELNKTSSSLKKDVFELYQIPPEKNPLRTDQLQRLYFRSNTKKAQSLNLQSKSLRTKTLTIRQARVKNQLDQSYAKNRFKDNIAQYKDQQDYLSLRDPDYQDDQVSQYLTNEIMNQSLTHDKFRPNVYQKKKQQFCEFNNQSSDGQNDQNNKVEYKIEDADVDVDDQDSSDLISRQNRRTLTEFDINKSKFQAKFSLIESSLLASGYGRNPMTNTDYLSFQKKNKVYKSQIQELQDKNQQNFQEISEVQEKAQEENQENDPKETRIQEIENWNAQVTSFDKRLQTSLIPTINPLQIGIPRTKQSLDYYKFSDISQVRALKKSYLKSSKNKQPILIQDPMAQWHEMDPIQKQIYFNSMNKTSPDPNAYFTDSNQEQKNFSTVKAQISRNKFFPKLEPWKDEQNSMRKTNRSILQDTLVSKRSIMGSQIASLIQENTQATQLMKDHDFDELENIIQLTTSRKVTSFRINMLCNDLRVGSRKPPMALELQEWLNYIKYIKSSIQEDQLCFICLEGFRGQDNQQENADQKQFDSKQEEEEDLLMNYYQKQEKKNDKADEHYLQFDQQNDHIFLGCAHQFHQICLNNYRQHYETMKCPVCKKLGFKEAKNMEKGSLIFVDWCASLIQKNIRKFTSKENFFSGILQKEYKPKSKGLINKLQEFLQLRVLSSFIKTNREKNTKRMPEIKRATHRFEAYHSKIMAVYTKQAKQLMTKQQKRYNDLINIMIDKVLSERTKWRTPRELAVWGIIKEKVDLRADQVCLICKQVLNNGTPLVLTQCTHSFHCPCLLSFLTYSQIDQIKQKCKQCSKGFTYELFIIVEGVDQRILNQDDEEND